MALCWVWDDSCLLPRHIRRWTADSISSPSACTAHLLLPRALGPCCLLPTETGDLLMFSRARLPLAALTVRRVCIMTTPSPFAGFSPPPPPPSYSYQYDMFRAPSFQALPQSSSSSQFHALRRPTHQPLYIHSNGLHHPYGYPQQQVVYVLPSADYANGSLPLHPHPRGISSSSYPHTAVSEDAFDQPAPYQYQQQPLPPPSSPYLPASSSSSSTAWNNDYDSPLVQPSSNGHTHSSTFSTSSPYPTPPAHSTHQHLADQQQPNPDLPPSSTASPALPAYQGSWRRVIAAKKKSERVTVAREQTLVMAENATFEVELTAELPISSSVTKSGERIDLNESDTTLALQLTSKYRKNKRPLTQRSAWKRCQHMFHMEARGMVGFNASDMAAAPMSAACSKRNVSLRRLAQTFRDVRSDDKSAKCCSAGKLALMRGDGLWHLHSVREPESQHGRTSGSHCIPLSLQVRSDYWKATYTGARQHRPKVAFKVTLLFALDAHQRKVEWSIPLDVMKSDGSSSSSSGKKRKRPHSKESDEDSSSDEGVDEDEDEKDEDEDEDEEEEEVEEGKEEEEEVEGKERQGEGEPQVGAPERAPEQRLPHDAYEATLSLPEDWPLSPLPSPSFLTARSTTGGTYSP